MASLDNTNIRSILFDTPEGGEGICLYDHLVSLLTTVDNTVDNSKTFENLENISHFIKSNKYVHFQPKSDQELKHKKDTDTFGVQRFSQKCQSFLTVGKTIFGEN